MTEGKKGELKPCPCCSGMPRSMIVDGWYRVTCTECGITGGRYYSDEQAEAAWNRRSDGEAVEEAIATERERCARIAEQAYMRMHRTGGDESQLEPDAIAAAIRSTDTGRGG